MKYLMLAVVWTPFVVMLLSDSWTIWQQILEACICSLCAVGVLGIFDGVRVR